MAWGCHLGAGKNACCRSLHFTGVQTDLVDPTQALTLNPFQALVWFMVLGGWYRSFGIAGDNAFTFAESLLEGVDSTGENVFESLFKEDDLGAVSEPYYVTCRLASNRSRKRCTVC